MSGRGSQYKTRIGSAVDDIRGFFTSRSNGYTIVEVMIFLAVTTTLFVMIIGTFSGRQQRAEFSTAAREMESRLQDIANDVSTGYYNNPGTFTCTVNLISRIPQINTLTASEQGTNRDCIFIGRVAQFAVSGDDKQYNLFTAVGSRLGDDGNDTDELSEANPRAITLPGLIEDNSMPVGLVMHSVWSDDGVSRTRISAVGFFTTFGAGPSGESSLTVDILPLGDGSDTATDIATAIAAISVAPPTPNPNGGIHICMNGDATNQHAVLRLGSSRGRLTTDVEIGDRKCEDVGY